MHVLDFEKIAAAQRSDAPYTHFYGEHIVRDECAGALRETFPNLRNPGYLTLPNDALAGAFGDLIETVQGQEFAGAVSDALSFDVRRRPTLVTVMNQCQKTAGRIHTDGKSKLATFLIYLNTEWPAGHAGCLRALRGPDDFDDFAVETPPLFGNFFSFVRSDHSWHGHLPFVGQRRVVQVTWLDSEDAVKRKQRNNSVAQALKSVSAIWRRA